MMHAIRLIRTICVLASRPVPRTILLAILCCLESGVVVRAQEPDYSKVNDILNGRRLLLQDDDLLVDFSPNGAQQTWVFQTKGLAVSKPVVSPVAATSCNQLLQPARLFNLPNQVTVSLVRPNGCSDAHLTIHVQDPTTAANNSDLAAMLDPTPLQIGAGDFNGDGFDDLVVANGQVVVLYSAVDPATPAKGLKEVARISIPSANQAQPAIGDFNGDGAKDIALVTRSDRGYYSYYSAVFLSVCPASNVSILGQKCTTAFQMISVAKTIPLASTDEGGPFLAAHSTPQLLSGNFKGIATQAQFISDSHLSLPGGADEFYHQLDGWDLNADFSTAHHSSFKIASTGTPDPGYWAAASLDSFSLGQQLVYVNDGSFLVSVFTFDSALNATAHSVSFLGPPGECWSSVGLAAGRYDPPNSADGSANFSLQIGVLYATCTTQPQKAQMRVYTVNPSPDFTPKEAMRTVIADTWPAGVTADPFGNITQPSANLLYAADTQGRSYALGEPTKVVIEGAAQPSVVIAMPPMHVDYIPRISETSPTLLNVTFDPVGFYTAYQVEDTKNDQSSTINSHSWSFGAKETVSGFFEWGSIKENEGVKLTDTTKAAQDLKHNVDIEHTSYSSSSFSVSQRTGWADQIWMDQSRVNIYVYPVIGQTVCPSTKPSCSDNEKVPLTIQYSAPDHSSSYTLAGDQISSYQPPWEYGNVLSYPANYSQLQRIVPDIQKLSTDLTWFTDRSPLTVMTTWKNGTTGGSTTSYNQNYSFDTTISVVGVTTGGVVNAGLSLDVNVGGSFGFNDLNKSSSMLGKSTGIGVTKPGTFLDPNNYGYFVTPYIFGEVKPSTVTDTTSPAPADVQSFSLLRSAFTVDPTSDSAGGWWRQVYTSAPDVALNHPSRWSPSSMVTAGAPPDNCRPGCVSLSGSEPNNPWVSKFHFMRGFFITNEASPGQGPQLTVAKAGDQLRLQARVYNYSLKQMGSATIVHVRYYLQPWNTDNQMPVGNSVLIGEDKLGPIPPFNTDENAPLNWVLSNMSFDTSLYQNKDLTFWVIVWMEDGNGKLVPEIQAHGLKSIPGTLNSLADVESEDYSNNVGFYKSVFHVFPKSSVAATAGGDEQGTVNIGNLELSRNRITAEETISVAAPLRARAGSLSTVTATFYDGDPHAGGTVFGVERAPYIQAGHQYLAKTLYQPSSCGVHDLFVVVDTPTETVRRSEPVLVACGESQR